MTAVADFITNDIIFISYDAETGLKATEDNEIMRIRTVEKDDAEAMEATKGMKLLGESEDLVYYALNSNYKTGKLALTESELNDSFVIL